MGKISISKDKIINISKNIKSKLIEHKIILMSIGAGLGIAALIIFNISLIQVNYYVMSGDAGKIANVLSTNVRTPKTQNKAYFNRGIEYLLKDMSEDSRNFLESYFNYFEVDLKERVVHTYNANGEYFADHQPIIESIAKGEQTPAMRTYINRLDMEDVELVLRAYYGDDIVLSQDIVEELNNVLKAHQQKLTMEKFDISIYELMKFPGISEGEGIAFELLDQIEPEVAHENLFTTLKTEAITVEELNKWVEVLNKKRIISTEEYAKFISSYTAISRIREEYVQLQHQEVDLVNVQQKIDAQTDEYEYQIEHLAAEIEALKQELDEKRNILRGYTDYSIIDLYIMDYYENGEYEASIPERSWFFDEYKPGRQRVTLKTTSTEPMSQGVYEFEVYYEGEDNSGNAIYREVSSEDKQRISNLSSEIMELEQAVQNKLQEKTMLEEEIVKIRNANNYEQNNMLLQDVIAKKNSVDARLNEQKVIIQNLFKIGEVIIELD